ncbi:MarR family winged helix-turn-helix transcriptional regulator [Paenalcaligenes hominis]|uniref:DNA-binding MarR family transcriptional regulator n=1 Tax=Paenalcaligenes hominis TaxID=643674 RepID=A0A1U9K1W9_9BURK|nr:MarR family transcriptional regulator [Paenalcaligenes hominis]AQS52031.1 hypothetical protein PAEH1_11635 [Paenalcaligenes hominis]NJB64687.1 DNA-binding MarR family transcriptional regulator [Paenalcaligenes hominis]GGE59896.1 transcriptional regulator [Paenalcaligenes hominis]
MTSFLHSQPLFQLYLAWSSANPMFVRLSEGRFNITRREWRVLATLSHFERLSASALAREVQLDLVRTSRTVTRLVEKGWVSRVKNSANARSVWVQLEPAGYAIFEQMRPLVEELNQLLIQDLTETEQKQLTTLLHTITQRAQQLNASALITDKARRGNR